MLIRRARWATGSNDLIRKKGFDVRSYGTGSHVKLPGTAIDKPNVYPFGKPYRQIYEDLVKKDENLCVARVYSCFLLTVE